MVIRAQKVTHAYPVTNSGDTTRNDAKVSEDKYATMKYRSGDADSDSKLQTSETCVHLESADLGGVHESRAGDRQG